jgi:hypothetical protein
VLVTDENSKLHQSLRNSSVATAVSHNDLDNSNRKAPEHYCHQSEYRSWYTSDRDNRTPGQDEGFTNFGFPSSSVKSPPEGHYLASDGRYYPNSSLPNRTDGTRLDGRNYINSSTSYQNDESQLEVQLNRQDTSANNTQIGFCIPDIEQGGVSTVQMRDWRQEKQIRDVQGASAHQSDSPEDSRDREDIPERDHDQQHQNPIYSRLPDRDSFRLLHIMPGNDEDVITCNLEVFRLSDAGLTYEALSYAWGNVSDQLTIKCNGHVVSVSRGLYEALKQLRHKEKDQSRSLWVDAICINQNSVQERGHQVKLMRRIYTEATGVIAWLGKDDKGDAVAAFSVICAIANEHLQSRDINETAFFTFPETDHTSLPWAYGTPPLDKAMLWNSVSRLYDREWFWRLWCVQEVSVASKACIAWGAGEIAWKWVGLAAARIRTNNYDVVRDYKMAGVFNAYFMYRISPHSSDRPILSLSFSQLLILTRQFEATDKRDRVFALLGLPNNDSDIDKGEFFLDPDYSVSFMEIYKRLAVEVLKRDRNLDFLSSVQHGEDLDPEYPSWIPRWDKVFTQIIRSSDRDGNFNACDNMGILIGAGYEPPSIESARTCQSYGCLKLEGIKVSSVSGFVPKLENLTLQPRNVLETYSEDFYQDQITWDPDVLCWTLTAGKDWYGTPVRDAEQHRADFAAAWQKYRPTVNPQLTGIAATGDHRRILESAENACRGRKLFSCNTISLGLGPAAMQLGDIVCILFGGHVPFVLRPVNGIFRLVGECYVYDLMDGEWTRNWKQSKQKENWFEIH